MIKQLWNNTINTEQFSGVFSASDTQGILFEACHGFRNRGEDLPVNRDTAFSIASGTKLFTALAVCKLVDQGHLKLSDLLWSILPGDLGRIDKRVTVYQLLTHTSGIGDYIDEEADDCTEQLLCLYQTHPIYLWEALSYYLPMITPLAPKFAPGERFSYSNAGFVLLGLVIEAVSGLSYQDFVQREIIRPLLLRHTGFYRADTLPPNTAMGYYQDETTGAWRANLFRLPIVGGSDGGLYTCADDLNTLWRAVFSGQVLSDTMLASFLQQHVSRREHYSYGLGVYRYDDAHRTAWYAVGGDFGVDFFTAYFPDQEIVASALGNTELNTFPVLRALLTRLPV